MTVETLTKSLRDVTDVERQMVEDIGKVVEGLREMSQFTNLYPGGHKALWRMVSYYETLAGHIERGIEVNEKMLQRVDDGFCPYCGEQLRPLVRVYDRGVH